MTTPKRNAFSAWPAEMFTLHGTDLVARFEKWTDRVGSPKPIVPPFKQDFGGQGETFFIAAFRTAPDWPGVPSPADQVREWLRAEAAEMTRNDNGQLRCSHPVTPDGSPVLAPTA